MMKVYGSKASPYVQRVLAAGRLKGHDLPVEMPPDGDLKAPTFRAISPMGRIPVLDDDGWTLAESAAIVAYLDETLDGAPLLPSTPRERARVRLLESLVACELGGIRPIMMGPMFGMPVAPELVEAAQAQVRTGLAAIEQVRHSDDALAIGAEPTAADCALFPLLTLIGRIVGAKVGMAALLGEYQNLVAYRDRMEAHPILGRTAEEMRTGFAEILAQRQAAAAA